MDLRAHLARGTAAASLALILLFPSAPNASALVAGCPSPTTYCISSPNSTGLAAEISSSGSTSIFQNDLTLIVDNIPNNSGIFITSPDAIQSPLGNGTVCVGSMTLGFVRRLDSYFGVNNSASITLDHSDIPLPALAVTPGSQWYYQAWFRDFTGSGFNFSDGLAVTYCP